MSKVSVLYDDGRLAQLTIYEPTKVAVTDCRDARGCPPFITVDLADENVEATAYLPPDLARNLHVELGKLLNTETKETKS